MPARVKLGIAREYFEKEGNLELPHPALQLLKNYPDIEHYLLPENNPEVSAQGCARKSGIQREIQKVPECVVDSS